jgi:uncharacterized protein (DUF488 family)
MNPQPQNPDNAKPADTIFTIGHSTRTFEELVELLRAHRVLAVADVRLIPRSRRHPHFSDEYLAEHLPAAGIRYLPFKSLGGRRRAAKDSPNTAWRNASFRGYADFMQTPPFERALRELIEAGTPAPTATMCAEAVPWRCHRSLIADALLIRGWRVLDILSNTKATPHKLTPFARVEGMKIVYPAGEGQRELFE